MKATVIINPGTGAVVGATGNQAYLNMVAFVADLRLNAEISSGDGGSDDGRFPFILTRGERSCTVDMPGIDLRKVRFLGEGGQNIWHFPRLYVDGSSWVWVYAIEFARRALTNEEQP